MPELKTEFDTLPRAEKNSRPICIWDLLLTAQSMEKTSSRESGKRNAMSVLHKVAKNTVIILSGQLVTLLLNLFVMVYIARHFGEEIYGMFTFAIAFTGFFAIIANFGMKPIIIREISADRTKARAILGTSIMIKLLLAVISIFLTIGMAFLLGYSQEQFVLIAIIAFTILVSSKITTFRFIFEAIFESELRMEYPILFRIIDAAFMAGFVVLLIACNYSIKTVAAFYIMSSIPGFLLTLLLSIRYFKPSFQCSLQMIKWLFIESWPLALYVGLTTVYTNGDVFLLKTLKNDAAVGYYSAAYRLTYPLTFIPAAFVMSLFPLMSRYYRDSKEKLISLFHFGIKVIMLIGLGLSLGTTFVYKRLTVLLYTEKYLSSALPLMLLMWAELFLFLNFFLIDFNTSVQRQKRNMYAILSMFVVNILANLFIIPKWGINGASFVKIVTNFLGFLVLFSFATKTIKIDVLPIIKKVVPIGIGFAIWMFFVSKFSFTLIIATSPIIFALLVIGLRFFNATEMRTLKDLLPKIGWRTLS